MRQLVLDTETTGLEPADGHRIIEIGCVELVNRRLTGNNYQQYIQPDRESDPGALEVHGITTKFLSDKPRFEDIANDFLEYVKGAELVIHNAPFDTGFIDAEFKRLKLAGYSALADACTITDSLKMARAMHPGQKNNLNALCKRYEIDNSQRTLHGALLDAEILADVYLAMTGGQTGLFEDRTGASKSDTNSTQVRRLASDRPVLKVIAASAEESAEHDIWLQTLAKASGDESLWKKLGL